MFNWFRQWRARIRLTRADVTRTQRRGGVTTQRTTRRWHLQVTPLGKPKARKAPVPRRNPVADFFFGTPAPKPPSPTAYQAQLHREAAADATAEARAAYRAQATRNQPAPPQQDTPDQRGTWFDTLRAYQQMGRLPERFTRADALAALEQNPALRQEWYHAHGLPPPPTGPARRPAVTQRLRPAQANTRPTHGAKPVEVKGYPHPVTGKPVKGYHRALPGQGGK